MASTYSPLLRVQLIGTGEQSGIWGDTTNTNLGTILEQAIAGSATFSVTGGSVTLTALDGIADQSRCAILNITGSPGASRNVIAPASSKVYVVINGSDGNVVLKTSTSTGLTIEPGAKIVAAYNGTDFVSVAQPVGGTILGVDATFTGDVTADAFLATSDERLKTDVVTLTNALDIVNSLRGVAYAKNGKAEIGVIAQEVAKILPQVVGTNDEGYHTVAYGNLVAVLIEAVKELSARVKALEGA